MLDREEVEVEGGCVGVIGDGVGGVLESLEEGEKREEKLLSCFPPFLFYFSVSVSFLLLLFLS